MVTVNPGVYFRELYPSYQRAAKICEVVYDNIERLFKREYDAGGTVATIITLGGDIGIIKCRCLLGHFKPTIGGTLEDVKQSVIDFNKLLKDNHITPHDFTGSELSDAEHFYASTVITMVPILGLVASPTASLLWDFLKPAASATNSGVQRLLSGGHWTDDGAFSEFVTNFKNNMRYDVDQLVGPDLAGHRYGMSITYYNNTKWWFNQ